MRTTIYEPFSTLRRLHDEMNRAFGQAEYANGDAVNGDTSAAVVSHWAPAVDVHELSDGFVVTAEVAGVRPEDIDITLENGVLTISGERSAQTSTAEDTTPRRTERVYGSFYRRFTLPESADDENVEARIEHGVLNVRIAKKAKIQPKKITVSG